MSDAKHVLKPELWKHIETMMGVIVALEYENKRLHKRLEQKSLAFNNLSSQQPRLEPKPTNVVSLQPNKTVPAPSSSSKQETKAPVASTQELLSTKLDTVQNSVLLPVAGKTQPSPSSSDSVRPETKGVPTVPRLSVPKSEKVDLQRSYLDAFLKNDTAAMKAIRTQTVRERDDFLSKKITRGNRKNNIVVLNFPRDARINTKEQYIDFLTSLDILSPSDRTHIREIAQRDSKRTGKLLLTISFDGSSDSRDKALTNSHWSKNKYLPIWGISVFPDLTYQERLQQKPVCA
jgi:hypothetical protein